jgi:sialidase-1
LGEVDMAARNEITRREIYVGVVQLVLALLLCLVYVVFLTSFGGEFWIVLQAAWILPAFLVLLVGGAVYATLMAARSLRSGRVQGVLSDLIPEGGWRIAWLAGWAVWNCVAAVLTLLVGKVLVLGALGSVPTPLIAILALPFVGYAGFLIVASLKLALDLVRRRRNVRLLRGATAAGLAFLFVFGGFAAVAVSWHPRWTPGAAHQVLFAPGEEAGRGYRIPAMVVLPGDVVLAFAESRVNAMSDLLDINLVMKRSDDGGQAWSPLRTVQDIGRHTVHSPCPVYDRETRTVWLPYCVDYRTLYVMSSADAGLTWSQPRNVSQELSLPAGTYCHNGPGNGIQLSEGRLIVPTSLGDARVLYSDDHGRTWVLGEPIGKGSEPQVFERADGAVCANLRAARGAQRIVACSHDGGQTWGAWSYHPGLLDAGTQASVLRYSTEESAGRNRLLFSNPGAGARGALTIRLSYDEGETWPVAKQVYEGAAGYSQLAVPSDGTILDLFEAGRHDLRESITLVRVDLAWLTDGADRP